MLVIPDSRTQVVEAGTPCKACPHRALDAVKRIKLIVNISIYKNNKYDIVKYVKTEKYQEGQLYKFHSINIFITCLFFFFKASGWVWWHRTLIPVFRRQRFADTSESKFSLAYIKSSTTGDIT